MNVILLHSNHRHVSGHLCGHLQGGENKNLSIVKTCVSHFTVKNHIICGQNLQFKQYTTEGKRRRRRRRKQLLDDLKENRRYWNMNEEVQDRTLCKARLDENMDLSNK